MKTPLIAAAAVLSLMAWTRPAQMTPAPMAETYSSLADAILALKHTEAGFCRSMLDGHFHAARAFTERGNSERAAAEMALFAAEGDNAIAGVRKRLLEGGHHHNAEGEAKGIYEPGFVIVTRRAKEGALAASAAMRQAGTDDARKAAWKQFAEIAEPLLAGK